MLLISRSQFTAKQLNRQAAKAGKDEVTEKNKLKKVRFPPPLLLPPFSKPKALIFTTTTTSGNPTKPPRHRQNLRPERDPETE